MDGCLSSPIRVWTSMSITYSSDIKNKASFISNLQQNPRPSSSSKRESRRQGSSLYRQLAHSEIKKHKVRQMSQKEYSSDGEFGMAIAAAAYAVSLQEGGSTYKKRVSFKGSETFLPRTKTRREDNKIKQTNSSGSFKRWFTDKEIEEGEESAGGKRVESGKEMRSGSRAPSTRKPAMTSFDNKIEDGNLGGKSIAEADAWEKAEMMKTKNRYDKMISMIVEWEKEKKAKAKHRLELKDNEPEKKRARALQKYGEEISGIEKVVGEARAMAEERKRNDEAKTREKAKQIRLTGKIPHTCCRCF